MEIGISQAKTHLSALVDRAANGETKTITKHGIPAARLVPVGEAPRTSSHREIVEGMRALRRRVNAGKMSVREMIRAGR